MTMRRRYKVPNMHLLRELIAELKNGELFERFEGFHRAVVDFHKASSKKDKWFGGNFLQTERKLRASAVHLERTISDLKIESVYSERVDSINSLAEHTWKSINQM